MTAQPSIPNPRKNLGDEMLTLDETAALLRVPENTLRYWRVTGAGPRSFKVGRHVRYWRADVILWLSDPDLSAWFGGPLFVGRFGRGWPSGRRGAVTVGWGEGGAGRAGVAREPPGHGWGRFRACRIAVRGSVSALSGCVVS